MGIDDSVDVATDIKTTLYLIRNVYSVFTVLYCDDYVYNVQ